MRALGRKWVWVMVVVVLMGSLAGGATEDKKEEKEEKGKSEEVGKEGEEKKKNQKYTCWEGTEMPDKESNQFMQCHGDEDYPMCYFIPTGFYPREPEDPSPDPTTPAGGGSGGGGGSQGNKTETENQSGEKKEEHDNDFKEGDGGEGDKEQEEEKGTEKPTEKGSTTTKGPIFFVPKSQARSRGCDLGGGLCSNYGMTEEKNCLLGLGICCCKNTKPDVPCNCADKQNKCKLLPLGEKKMKSGDGGGSDKDSSGKSTSAGNGVRREVLSQLFLAVVISIIKPLCF